MNLGGIYMIFAYPLWQGFFPLQKPPGILHECGTQGIPRANEPCFNPVCGNIEDVFCESNCSLGPTTMQTLTTGHTLRTLDDLPEVCKDVLTYDFVEAKA